MDLPSLSACWSRSVSAVTFHIACCKCGRPIPLSQDVYALDREWQRRFPSMRGILACQRCALGTAWRCEKPGGREYVNGHIAVPGASRMRDFDAWSHVESEGTHRAMVLTYPYAGLLQGAEAYLRSVAVRRGVDADIVRELRVVIEDWDTRTTDTGCSSPMAGI